jgi:hypothetical protein
MRPLWISHFAALARGTDRPLLERGHSELLERDRSDRVTVAHNLTTADNVRLFALLILSFADCVIAFYDAKSKKAMPTSSG